MAAVDKTVTTLGEILLADAQSLARRHKPVIPWLRPLKPVIARTAAQAGRIQRFIRHDGVPRPSPGAAPVVDSTSESEPDALAGEQLPPATRDSLRALIGPAVDRARVHTGANADAFTRRSHAAAVTMGEDVYFRSSAYAPDTASGRGLIAHELTHVAESVQPGVASRRATRDGIRDEERVARARERHVAGPAMPMSPLAVAAQAARRDATAPVLVPASPQPPPGAGVAPNLRPMRADEDRGMPPPPEPPAAANLDTIRRGLYRDLMNQIRVEFERGA